jgi:hypothetical protein
LAASGRALRSDNDMGTTGATAGACGDVGADAGAGDRSQTQNVLATMPPPTKARALSDRAVRMGAWRCEGM